MSRAALFAVLILSFASGTFAEEPAEPPPGEQASSVESTAVATPAEPEPLHRQIDALMAQSAGPKAPIANDATFQRRVMLDLIGRVPNYDETVAFLGDESPDKRTKLVDRLLASSEYAEHFATVFDVMLMERRGNKHVSTELFRQYLQDALAANRSYREIVAEILAADGTDERLRAASAFYLEREVEPHLLTRDVGRVFFGVDLQCAQCHDHPLIDDYHQSDYYGLNAFFVRSSLFRPDTKQPALIGEAAVGEANFKSVFTEREGSLGPRIPGGVELAEVSLKPTEQYEVVPDKTVRGIPTTSRRDRLAETLLSKASEPFDRNIANRLWAKLFGRGLVHPVDLMHSDNPPSHPELLDLLATQFAANNYDIRAFLRELALTEAYQRDYRLPSLELELSQAAARIEVAKSTADKANVELAGAQFVFDQKLTALDELLAKAKPFRDAEDAANKTVAEAAKKRDAAQVKVTASESKVTQQTTAAELLKASVEATRKASETLKDDKELATALATIEQRVTAQEAERKKSEEAHAAERAALATAETELTTASTAADDAIAKRQEPEKQVRNARAEMFAARDVVQQLREQSRLASREVDYWQSLLDYDHLNKEETRLIAAIDSLEETLKGQVASKDAAIKLAAVKQQERVVAQQGLNKADAVHQQATADLATAKEIVSDLQAAISKAQAVQTKIDGDESLPEAIKLLDQSLKEAEGVVGTRDTVLATAATEQKSAKATYDASVAEVAKADAAAAEAKAVVEKSTAEIASHRQQLTAVRQRQPVAHDELVALFATKGHLRKLTALSPEQLASSMVTVTGQLERLTASANSQADKRLAKLEADHKAAVEKATKEGKAAPETPTFPSRDLLFEEELAKARDGIAKRFVDLYGAEAGQPQTDFFATADQSLFAANGNDLRSWLTPGGSNLTARLLALEDPTEIANQLYLGVLNRRPEAAETTDVTNYLADRTEQKSEAVQELAWALLTSVEFRFQH